MSAVECCRNNLGRAFYTSSQGGVLRGVQRVVQGGFSQEPVQKLRLPQQQGCYLCGSLLLSCCPLQMTSVAVSWLMLGQPQAVLAIPQ